MSNTNILVTDRTVTWTTEYDDSEEAGTEMVLAIPDEYPSDVVDAVVAYHAQYPSARA